MDKDRCQKSQQKPSRISPGIINLESVYDHTGHDEIQGDHRQSPAFFGSYKMKFYQKESAAMIRNSTASCLASNIEIIEIISCCL